MNYRLYFFDEGGKILGAPRQFTAASDAVAVELAETLREGRKAELWSASENMKAFEGRPGRPS
jgi:hypothetical protein